VAYYIPSQLRRWGTSLGLGSEHQLEGLRFAPMAKNQINRKFLKVPPSFLIEVMALECLAPPFGSRFEYEFQSIFSTYADRIADTWEDPAGLGPPVSDLMGSQAKSAAQSALQSATRKATLAIDLARQGKNGEFLKAWRALFGPKFPLS
jgi:hypothetical protein